MRIVWRLHVGARRNKVETFLQEERKRTAWVAGGRESCPAVRKQPQVVRDLRRTRGTLEEYRRHFQGAWMQNAHAFQGGRCRTANCSPAKSTVTPPRQLPIASQSPPSASSASAAAVEAGSGSPPALGVEFGRIAGSAKEVPILFVNLV